MRRSLKTIIIRTLWGVALALLIGVLASPVWAWCVLSLWFLCECLRNLRHLFWFENWSKNPSPAVNLDGDGVWYEACARLIRHERKLRSTIARRESDLEQVAAAGQAIVDGIVTLAAGSRIVWCNKTAERLLGLNLSVDQGSAIINLIRYPSFVSYMAAGDFSEPLRLLTEHPEDRVLSILVLPYAGDEQLLQIRDVTDAERLDQTRRDFVANVSHELRTPLTVLSGFVETMIEHRSSEAERESYLSLMQEQSDRMQRIVQDLLTLSTLESSPLQESELIDMRLLLERVQRDAEALSGGQHKISLAQDEALKLLGAEGELYTAFSNLVFNAVRYTPAGGEIRLEWQQCEDGAEFSVSDNGAGIDAKHLTRITERFYRVDKGRSRATGGTGLGLAIVKHALLRHQAKLEITSSVGEGSRFSAVFPARRVVMTSGGDA